MSSIPLRSVQDRPARTAPTFTRDLCLVAPPQHPRRYLVIGLLLVALGVFGVVSLHALASEAAFEARQLEERVTELSLTHDELVAEVAQLESPQHLRAVAEQQLGMVQASEPGYLVAGEPPTSGTVALGDGSDAGGSTPPAPAAAPDGRG